MKIINLHTDVQLEIFKYLHYQDLFNLENADADNILSQHLQIWWNRVYKLNICDDFSLKNLHILLQKTRLNLREINIENVGDFEQFILMLGEKNDCCNKLEKIIIEFDHLRIDECNVCAKKKYNFVKFVNLKHLVFKNGLNLITNGVSEFIKIHANQLITLEIDLRKKFFNYVEICNFNFKKLKHLKLTGYVNFDEEKEIEKYKNLKSFSTCIYNVEQLNFIKTYMHNLKNLTLSFAISRGFETFDFKNFFSTLLIDDDNVIENLILHNFETLINVDLHLFLLEKKNNGKILNLEYGFQINFFTIEDYLDLYNSINLYAKNISSLIVSNYFFEKFFCFCSICQDNKTEEQKKYQQDLLMCIFENVKTLEVTNDCEFEYVYGYFEHSLRKCSYKFEYLFFNIFNEVLSKNLKTLKTSINFLSCDVWHQQQQQQESIDKNNKLENLYINCELNNEIEQKKMKNIIKNMFLNLKKFRCHYKRL